MIQNFCKINYGYNKLFKLVMIRKVFYSFHFDNDNWRAGQVRNIGAVEGDKQVNGNKWEDIKSSSETKN